VLDLGKLTIRNAPPSTSKKKKRGTGKEKEDNSDKYKGPEKVNKEEDEVEGDLKKKKGDEQEEAEGGGKPTSKALTQDDFYDKYYINLTEAHLFISIPKEQGGGGKEAKIDDAEVVDNYWIVQLLEKLDINVVMSICKVPSSDLIPTR